MVKVGITGHRSIIAEQFMKLHSGEVEFFCERAESMPPNLDKYFFCQGFLSGKSRDDISKEDYIKTWESNYNSIARACDKIMNSNQRARICIIGSESGYRGSYDSTYAESKKAIHEYIETKPILYPDQQIVGIAPHIIADTRMTMNRTDVYNLNNKRNNHPMKRFLTSMEVAKMAFTLLYEQPYINRTIIRMHGGNL